MKWRLWYRRFKVRQSRAKLSHDKRVLQDRVIKEGKETTREHVEEQRHGRLRRMLFDPRWPQR